MIWSKASLGLLRVYVGWVPVGFFLSHYVLTRPLVSTLRRSQALHREQWMDAICRLQVRMQAEQVTRKENT